MTNIIKSILVSTLLFQILFTNAYACICIKLGDDFFDTVNQHNNKVKSGEYPQTDALTIFTGRVIKYQPMPDGAIPPSMQIKIAQVIQGEVNQKTVWVDGDTNGMECRPPIITFDIGKTYIVAAQKDEKNRYYISSCGYYSQETTFRLGTAQKAENT